MPKDRFRKFTAGIGASLRGATDFGDTDYRDVMRPNMRSAQKRLESSNQSIADSMTRPALRRAGKSSPKR